MLYILFLYEDKIASDCYWLSETELLVFLTNTTDYLLHYPGQSEADNDERCFDIRQIPPILKKYERSMRRNCHLIATV